MILGETGTGKSKMLKFMEKLSPKSAMCMGGNATSEAGLIGFKKGNTFVSGAMIQASNGLLLIDELHNMRLSTSNVLNETMEHVCNFLIYSI